ncbi:hypothetical protein M8C21_000338 [Ambrosia artemisiifolia]|uniref:Uncharacterized protein n=1 Tax=Ambrosia artemisiifolia TaxID=4212 RepID=A0AAD5GPP6_AMBAR|nr:hypothetical protein M8C21_000338 [Ambrosia artemisiifolia]
MAKLLTLRNSTSGTSMEINSEAERKRVIKCFEATIKTDSKGVWLELYGVERIGWIAGHKHVPPDVICESVLDGEFAADNEISFE